MRSEPPRPGATYRLQLREGVGFEQARRLVPHLERLGVTDLYLSPPFLARAGSAHGYDVVDPTRLDPALGGPEGFERLAAALRSRGMGLIVDVVPNHMAASPENPWWGDVLRHGRSSRFARFFDVDWDAPGALGRLILPVLGAPTEDVLQAGGFSVGSREGRPWLRVDGLELPLAPAAERMVLSRGARWWTRDRRSPARVAAYRGLLEAQAYRLVWWREGNELVNHRRFFDVSDLVALRQEDPAVFAATHSLMVELVRRGLVTGLRIDHIDGLSDPTAYLARLRRAVPSVHLVVEKILDPDERLPRKWPVDGTTGYGLLNDLNDLFVDPAGWRDLAGVVDRFRASPAMGFAEVRLDSRRRALQELFAAEVGSLVRRLGSLARRERRPIGGAELWEAVVEVTAALSVYRTYARGSSVGAEDRRLIGAAVRDAAGRIPRDRRVALVFVRRVLLLEVPEDASARTRSSWADVLRRWQLLSGPAAAKGVEDTALYRDVRLSSRNEVGGDPGAEPIAVEAFHRRIRRYREGRWPLVATTTHDTKRSEDVRARLDVLSEMPRDWERSVRRWSRANRRHRRSVRGEPVPNPDEELFLYQTLVGAWPIGEEDRAAFDERIRAYVVKAAREARLHTSWLDPDEGHEDALGGFVHAVLSDAGFVADLEDLVRVVAFHGAMNSLSQTVLRSVLPGAVDVYRGAETWALDLVDPDNRRPVDLDRLGRTLAELDAGPPSPEELLTSWPDGRVKLWVLSRALRLRRDRPATYQEGSYLPVTAVGPRASHVVAIARRRRRAWVLAVAPRLGLRVTGPLVPPIGRIWGRTSLRLPSPSPDRWRDALTGDAIEVRASSGGPALDLARVLRRFPVALLASEAAARDR